MTDEPIKWQTKFIAEIKYGFKVTKLWSIHISTDKYNVILFNLSYRGLDIL